MPNLRGRLGPILDVLDRTCLHAQNIAINGKLRKPARFAIGEDLRLGDAEGQEALIRILAIIGQSSLLRYRRYRRLDERTQP